MSSAWLSSETSGHEGSGEVRGPHSQSLGHHCQWGSHSASLYLLRQLVHPYFTLFILLPLERAPSLILFSLYGKTDFVPQKETRLPKAIGKWWACCPDKCSVYRLLGELWLPKKQTGLVSTLNLHAVAPPHPGSHTARMSQVAAKSMCVSVLSVPCHSRLKGMGPWCKAGHTKQILHVP